MTPLDDFISNTKDLVEHTFNDHTWYDASWCWDKELIDKCHNIDLNRLAGIDQPGYNIEMAGSSEYRVKPAVKSPTPDIKVHESDNVEEQYILDIEYGEIDSDYDLNPHSDSNCSSDNRGYDNEATDEIKNDAKSKQEGYTHVVDTFIFFQFTRWRL